MLIYYKKTYKIKKLNNIYNIIITLIMLAEFILKLVTSRTKLCHAKEYYPDVCCLLYYTLLLSIMDYIIIGNIQFN